MADPWREFWVRETGTGQQVAFWMADMMMMMMMMTSAEFRCGCTKVLSSSDNRVLMVLHKFCLKWTGKIWKLLYILQINENRLKFSSFSPRMYVQTEGQNSAVLQTHRSVISQSIQAVRLRNFFPVLPRTEIYLHCQVFCGGTVMSTGKYLPLNST